MEYYQAELEKIDRLFGQKDLYMWSTYILPNGHFLNPENCPEEELPEYDWIYEHEDFDQFTKINLWEYCLKMNVTFPYIALPEKMTWTKAQQNALIEILENYDLFAPDAALEASDLYNAVDGKYSEKMVRPVLIVTQKGDKVYDAASQYMTADEIVRDINKALIRGRFESSFELDEAINAGVDNKLLNLVDKCIDFLVSNGYGISKDDFEVKELTGTQVFGRLTLRKNPHSPYILELNKYLVNEPEQAIKKTIFHELCHYLVNEYLIDQGLYYFDSLANKWKGTAQWQLNKSYYSAHGQFWKQIAAKVECLTGQDIQRTDTYNTHTEVGKVYDEKMKYIVHCKNCGNDIKYMKLTDFVKNPNKTQYEAACEKYSKENVDTIITPERQEVLKQAYNWRCGNCGKGGCFETINVKEQR